MNTRYNRQTTVRKPTSMDHVRVGEWAEVCVGEWDGDSRRIVFGYVVAIRGNRITLRIADEVFSTVITGLSDGEEIEVDLEDIFGSEYSPGQIEIEAQGIASEFESQVLDEYSEEFEAFCPPLYRSSKEPLSARLGHEPSPEESHEWNEGWLRLRRAFVDQLIQSGRVQ